MGRRIFKWKQLEEFALWCARNPDDGKTIVEVANEFLSFDLDAITAREIRDYYAKQIRKAIGKLKNRELDGETMPFIATKTLRRNGKPVVGYCSLRGHGAEDKYLTAVHKSANAMLNNTAKLFTWKEKLRALEEQSRMVAIAVEKKKKKIEVSQ